jgi:hypothetical protein
VFLSTLAVSLPSPQPTVSFPAIPSTESMLSSPAAGETWSLPAPPTIVSSPFVSIATYLNVIAATAEHTAGGTVVARSTPLGVVASPAAYRVLVRPAPLHVVALLTSHYVVAFSAVLDVIAAAADQDVVTGQTVLGVLGGITPYSVITGGTSLHSPGYTGYYHERYRCQRKQHHNACHALPPLYKGGTR